MLEINESRGIKQLAFGLGALSLISLVVTTWVLLNVHHEQAIVTSLINHLQGSDLQVANELSSELGLQSGLSVLLVVNLLATAVAFSFVVRGYFSSERNLEDVKVLATDILASMDAGVITTDKVGKIIGINPRGRELVGLGMEESQVGLDELGPEHALLVSITKEIGEHHQPIRDRDYRLERDGHRITLRAGCTMLRNRQKEEIGLVIHVRDVTEKALMEERLRRMERFMGLGSLAAGLQHEIKNPLSALSLHIQLLYERLQSDSMDEEVQSMLEVINTEVRRISSVLDGFRSYASIHDLGKAPVPIAILIEKLIRLLRPDAEQKNVRLSLEDAAKEEGMVLADAAQLEQVFLNMALNAIAAMPGGGELRFRISSAPDRVRIDIADSGNGIPVEIQSQIFDPYFTTRKDGTGMGLALCDKIVRQHDGSIDFETSPKGTIFTLWLPSYMGFSHQN